MDNLSGIGMRKNTLILILLFSTALMDALALEQNTTEDNSVGIGVGDWVKYSVNRLGPDPTAWTPPPMKKAVSVKVEVQNVSNTVVTIRETIYLTDGTQTSREISEDLQKTMSSGFSHYILPANLNAGDKIGERVVFVATDDSDYKEVELAINATVSRSYGGLTREVNMLKYSFLMPFFEYMNNYSAEYYWDRESGFMLEKTWQTYYLELGNATPMSTLQLKISDTNMWKMEIGHESTWNQLWPWAAVGLVLAVVTGTTIFMKLPRNSRKRTKVYEKR